MFFIKDALNYSKVRVKIYNVKVLLFLIQIIAVLLNFLIICES